LHWRASLLTVGRTGCHQTSALCTEVKCVVSEQEFFCQ